MRSKIMSPCAAVAVSLAWTATQASSPATRQVNPATSVDPSLQPYVYRFNQALELHGFTVANSPKDGNLALKVVLDPGAVSINITASLLDHDAVLVTTPVSVTTMRNLPFLRKSAIADAAEMAANRFSKDLAAYVRSHDDATRPASAGAASTPDNTHNPGSARVDAPPNSSAAASSPSAATTAAASAPPAPVPVKP